ncbi:MULTISPECIES: hypothetical protein [Clostridium]|uniref:Uncharacterized protein n=1 Tax=Clostridium lapidicellarium TaxID=3240931 RepID=A0ABV4DVY4_9CLOT
MKTYRTIDLLNAVYNGKIFENNFKNIETGEVIKQGRNHTKKVRSNIEKNDIYSSDQTKHFFIVGSGRNFMIPKDTYTPLQFEKFLKEEWKEVQQPVSFIEAIESCKPIRVEHEYFCMHGNYQDTDHLLMKMGRILTPYQIKKVTRDGKWYIKEEI